MNLKNYLKSIAITMLTMFCIVSCTNDNNSELIDESIKTRVNNAEIISGQLGDLETDLSISNKFSSKSLVAVQIPSKNGYIAIEKKSGEEKNIILEFIYKRFQKEFDENKNDENISSRTAAYCGAWEPVDESDPNTGAKRLCYDPFFEYTYYEYCVCGYCC